MRRCRGLAGGWLALTMAAAACSPVDATIEELDLDWNRMLVQPKQDPYERNDFFEDGMVMRAPPEGTVRWAGKHPRPTHPPEIDGALLERGRERFEIFCGACHGVNGYGDTMVARNMSLRPAPSLHTPRARGYSEERLYRIVTEGYGLMPSYEAQLGFRDRWAVVHYLRALQLSQHVARSELPPSLRTSLDEAVSP